MDYFQNECLRRSFYGTERAKLYAGKNASVHPTFKKNGKAICDLKCKYLTLNYLIKYSVILPKLQHI